MNHDSSALFRVLLRVLPWRGLPFVLLLLTVTLSLARGKSEQEQGASAGDGPEKAAGDSKSKAIDRDNDEKKPLAVWIKQLKEGDLPARRQAVRALGRLGPQAEDAVPALIDSLKDNDHIGVGTSSKGAFEDSYAYNSMREAAVWALLRMGPKAEDALLHSGVPLLVAGLTDSDPGVRDHSARALGAIGPKAKAAVPALKDCLRDKNASVRRAASFALESFGAEAVPALLEGLKSRNVTMRREVAGVLRWGRVKIPVASLIEALRDEDPRVRYCCVCALGYLGPEAKDAVPELIKKLNDMKMIRGSEEKSSEDVVVETLARIGAEAVPALTGALRDKDDVVRAKAARTLGEIGLPAKPAVPTLMTALHDQSVMVSLESACALVRVGEGPREPIKVLTELLKHQTAEIRWNAADGLRRIGKKGASAVPALIRSLKDEDVQVRRQAARALEKMGDQAKEAVPALTSLLKDGDLGVRYDAARVLEKIGPDESAVPALMESFRREQGRIYPNPSGEALKKLGPRAKAAVPELIEMLKMSKNYDAVDFIEVLQAIGPEAKESVPVLIAFLSPPPEKPSTKSKPVGPRVQSAAIRALGKIGPASAPAVPKLTSLLQEEAATELRAEIARTMGEIGPAAKSAAPQLRQAKKSDEAEERVWAAAALIQLTGDAENHLPVILTVLRDKNITGRKRNSYSQAVAALAWLGPPVTKQAIPELRGVLKHDLLWERLDAARALGQLEEQAKEAVPDLVELLKSDDSRVRKAAVVALGQIGPLAADALPLLRKLSNDEEDDIDQVVAEALAKIQR